MTDDPPLSSVPRSPVEEEPWVAPPAGSTIRLMGDHGVTVPLWEPEGLLFGEPSEAVEHFGVSAELAADLAAWAQRWDLPPAVSRSALDTAAAELVDRLTRETQGRYVFVYES